MKSTFHARWLASSDRRWLAKYYWPPSSSLRSWRDFARECFCFGGEAINASGEAARGLVKSRVLLFRWWSHKREWRSRERIGEESSEGIWRLPRRSPANESRQLRRLSQQQKKDKMAFIGILSQIKLLFGPLVIQLVWYILRQLFTLVSVKVVDIYLHFGEQ